MNSFPHDWALKHQPAVIGLGSAAAVGKNDLAASLLNTHVQFYLDFTMIFFFLWNIAVIIIS